MKSIEIKRQGTKEHVIEEVCNLFIYFSIYSVIGWIYETIFCSFEAGHLVNRGFLFGPYLPIYGSGAVLIIAILGKEKSIPKLFFKSMILTSILEYVTATVLEVLFNKTWWDYSDYTFNFQGKISLIAAMAFGLFAIILNKVLQPRINKYIDCITLDKKLAFAKVGAIFLITDIILSTAQNAIH